MTGFLSSPCSIHFRRPHLKPLCIFPMSHCPGPGVIFLQPGQDLSNCDLTGRVIRPLNSNVRCLNFEYVDGIHGDSCQCTSVQLDPIKVNAEGAIMAGVETNYPESVFQGVHDKSGAVFDARQPIRRQPINGKCNYWGAPPSVAAPF